LAGKSKARLLALGAVAMVVIAAAIVLRHPSNLFVTDNQSRSESTRSTTGKQNSDEAFAHAKFKIGRESQSGNHRDYIPSESFHSGDNYPKNVLTKDYRDALMTEVRSNPPKLLERGDPKAVGEIAYRIYLYYRFCIRSPHPNQADKWLDDLAERTSDASTEELERAFKHAEDMTQRVDKCLQTSSNTDRDFEAFKWLGEAAGSGHEIAQIEYYQAGKELLCSPLSGNSCLLLRRPELIEEFKVTANRTMFEALERGHPEAYLAMSEALLDDVVFVKNPVAALAYVKAAKFVTSENRIIMNMIGVREYRISQFLTLEEIADAEVLADEISIELGG
jgi:hypothetical protein